MADAVAAGALDNIKAFVAEDKKWRRLQLESVVQRKRVFVPKVDPRNPFRAESQLLDQYELRELNRNPRLYIQSSDRAQSLRRVYNRYGQSTSPRGYVDHVPASASADFKATIKRAVPRHILNPGVKRKGLGKRAQLLRDVREPIREEPSDATGSSRRSSTRKSSAAPTARSRRSVAARSLRSRRSTAKPGSGSGSRSTLGRMSKSSTAPAGLNVRKQKKKKSINDMAPSAPSFGHRPSSASRHFDALSMRANRLDPTPVGRLELPNNSPHKQLDAKYGVGLLSATDLRMLGGEADGAAHHVPRAGMTQLADRTAAQLLWKTSHAAAHPPTKKKGRGAGASDSKRGSKDHDHALHNTPGHITGFTVTSIPKNFDESVSSVEELRAAETAAAVASAKAVRARAHRGAVPPPKVGVGTGFAYTPEVVMPRFQVTSGKGTPGGLLSAEYADAMAVKQAVRDGDDVRKMRVWRRQRARDVEMLDDLAALRDEPISMLDSSTLNGGPLGPPQDDASSVFTSSDGPGSVGRGFTPLGSPPYMQDDPSMFSTSQHPSALGEPSPSPLAAPPQYDAETDTWITPSGQADAGAASVFTTSTGRSSRRSSGRRRKGDRGRRGKKKKNNNKKLGKQQAAARAKAIALEAGWDDSPHFMLPAAFERMAAFKVRARERVDRRSATESMEYYARRAAGTLEPHMMFCAHKYQRDEEEANNDVTNSKRTYLKNTLASSNTPRDLADTSRFNVENALKEENMAEERRRSMSKTNERRRSVGLPPLRTDRSSSGSASAIGSARRSYRSGGQSARSRGGGQTARSSSSRQPGPGIDEAPASDVEEEDGAQRGGLDSDMEGASPDTLLEDESRWGDGDVPSNEDGPGPPEPPYSPVARPE